MSRINKKNTLVLLLLFLILISVVGAVYWSEANRVSFDINNKDELKGDITFVSNRTDKKDELEELIKEFENLHQKVSIELKLIGDAESILQRKASVGELPDVTLVPSTITKNEYNKYFLTIDDLGFNDNNMNNYDMGVGSDSRLYCLNSSITWQGVIYNKEIFKKANIENLPTSIDELFDVCEKVKALGVIPMAINYRQSWTMNLWVDIIPHLFDNSLSKETVLGNETILNSKSGMYKSLNLIREIVKREYCESDLLSYEWQQFKNDMNDGKIAMTIWNSDFINQLEDMGMDESNIGMFPIPETEIVKIYGDYKFAVSKKSDYPEVAKAFLKYIFEESRYSKAVNNISSLKEDDDSKIRVEAMKNFGIPVEFYSDFIRNQSVYDAKLQEDFLNIKSKNGLDASFVQKYIVEDNIESLVNEIEDKWKKSIEE
ncbi:extracellular solute-binding protein [Clostridium sp. D53t1_180928_C8]|uniref:ABC transporter substrate-binding protein n=1 Tax=Clostridium sp. D53t1_180928_C8 TaxID=2787101 RepID=UPI0018AB6389|nr:extracellular solute-binding protein [Clostridium sp. D53t1_180928_C8]